MIGIISPFALQPRIFDRKKHMKDLNRLMTEIAQLTANIETNYPELYPFLDEEPLTIPSDEHPEVDKEALKAYLESLKKMLKTYIENHKNQPGAKP